ncbi:hypothetical protein [Pseudomonas sp. NPDC087626]
MENTQQKSCGSLAGFADQGMPYRWTVSRRFDEKAELNRRHAAMKVGQAK